MMAEISKLGCLSRVYTNHCVRATSITALDNAGIEARHIMRASGHRSESSIRSYSCRLSETKKREISQCLGDSDRKLYSAPPSTHVPRTSAGLGQDTVNVSDISLEDLKALFSDKNVFADDINLPSVAL